MSSSQVRVTDLTSRAVGLGALGLITCFMLWLFIWLFEGPTESKHEYGQTYLPDGLYAATLISLIVAYAITVVADFVLGKSKWSWFVGGFLFGLIIFLFNVPWSQLDRGAGMMFNPLLWWLPPIAGVVVYTGHAIYAEFGADA